VGGGGDPVPVRRREQSRKPADRRGGRKEKRGRGGGRGGGGRGGGGRGGERVCRGRVWGGGEAGGRADGRAGGVSRVQITRTRHRAGTPAAEGQGSTVAYFHDPVIFAGAMPGFRGEDTRENMDRGREAVGATGGIS